ncbi:MAG: hypothetical protein UU67_C0043G0003 [Candidatus Daviesbacteria bacterium GW2011_GWB1_41_5]|uniref:Uncharacterized protein n=1 Tax=Candidatus Daviesbacteria bacterium GW2011_GWB1_41_5 TaxID=1618429 RepID=A0A0G0WII9_9BACT|nr:MAG: hypothetical protein UU67_C0043G0003 [Candidatus Daviesbacteria bacterium GW2011_GWB1_41_5]
MISIKKLATVGAAGGLLLASAVPAFALFDDDLVIGQGNTAIVTNNVGANANTGLNGVGGGKFVMVKTGDALAIAGASTTANKNVAVVAGCNCFDDVTVGQGNTAIVTNNVGANANTGLNGVGGGKIVVVWTGGAQSQATVSNVVNKNVAIVH